MKIKHKLYIATPIILIILISLFFCLRIPQKLNIHIFRKGDTLFGAKEKITFEDIFEYFSFSEKKALDIWKNKIFKGKTIYWIDEKNNEKFLHSESKKTASALYHLVSYKIKDFPILCWKWRPLKFPDKSGVKDPKLKDDYALRIYVIFASGFFTNFKCVEYLWDESLKEGTKMASPYSDNIMQLVIRSGLGSEDWISEERDVLEDYTGLFGKEPKLDVRAIAIMSDSEGSQDSCEAHFKEIKIVKRL